MKKSLTVIYVLFNCASTFHIEKDRSGIPSVMSSETIATAGQFNLSFSDEHLYQEKCFARPSMIQNLINGLISV